ncbi:hypothetical protein CK203_024289 [Vitis vinifera]|uniref:Uncharacterized protein n=1 Tax=Vitis vinifera TaxID=29760 RepID=A0A438I4F6_VITVI|nr:hypothetical protein CK203_024289 [Vitis vinifera]
MCGGDDHLAWKRPVSSEACRGLHTAGGSIDTFDLGSTSWIRVRGRLIRVSDQSDQSDMDSQVVTVDQFAAAMASIQEAITSLGQRMDGQQAQQVPVQERLQYDPTIPPPLPPSQIATQDTQMPPPPPLGQTVPQPTPFTLQSQTEVTPPPAMVVVPTSEDTMHHGQA